MTELAVVGPEPLPRGAKTALKVAKVAQATMRRYNTRGPRKPPEEYWVARARFLGALRHLSRLGMTHQAIGAELGLSRPAVSNWMKATEIPEPDLDGPVDATG
jgi:hypothetical protein